MIEGISAVTLGTHEMLRAVRFYRSLGFEVLHGGDRVVIHQLSSRDELSQSYRPAYRAVLVLVGPGNLLRCRC